jgi:hypothetical protein
VYIVRMLLQRQAHRVAPGGHIDRAQTCTKITTKRAFMERESSRIDR